MKFYDFFVIVLQCIQIEDVQDGCHSLTWDPFSHKKSMTYSGHRKLLCELSKLSKFNAFNLLGY